MCLCSYCLNTSVGLANGVENNIKQNTTSEKINLVWQPIIDEENDLSKIEKLPGVNVVSPSWLVINNDEGHIQLKIDQTYLEKVTQKGYKVWPLLTNNFDPEMTHKWLNNEQARKYIIRQLVFYAERYAFAGYNFDLENIYDEDRDKLTLFMQEVSEALHQNGLVVSMDITVKSNILNWSKCYNREELAKYVDYLILMAYDEHGRLSKTAGSVASLNWVENGIKELLKENVPANKIILGIPLYMRLWVTKLLQ